MVLPDSAGFPQMGASGRCQLESPLSPRACPRNASKSVPCSSHRAHLIYSPFSGITALHWSCWSWKLLLHVFCPFFLVVSGMEVNLVPVTLSWLEGERTLFFLFAQHENKYFKVNNLETVSIFTLLFNYLLCLIPNHFHHPLRKPITQLSPTHLCSALAATLCVLSLWTHLFRIFHTNEVLQYVTFCVSLLLLSMFLRFMHASVLHSF